MNNDLASASPPELQNKKCSDLESEVNDKSMAQIGQLIKLTTKFKSSCKTVYKKNKNVYTAISASKEALKEVALEQTQSLLKKQLELIDELMKNGVYNLEVTMS